MLIYIFKNINAISKVFIFSILLQFTISLHAASSLEDVTSYGSLTTKNPLKSRAISKTSTKDSLYLVAERYYNSAIDSFRINQISISFEKAKQAYEMAKKNDLYVLKIKSLRLLSLIYEKKGNLEKSLACLREANKLNDIYFYDSDNSNLKGSYFPKIENKILQLEEANSKQEKSLKFNQLAIVLSVLLIIILSLFTLSLYKNNNLRAGANELLQKKNKELFEAKEKAEQANKIKENFLSTISHELRTPIYGITGLTYLLLQENPNKAQEEYLNSLKYSGDHLLSLINNILDINKLSAKKVKKINTDFNLRAKMNGFYKSFTKVARDKQVKMHMHIDDQIPEELNGDILKISQVLINLVSNAVKFTENGDIWIRLNLVKEKENQVVVLFEVEDNGIGIEKKHQKAIFKNFNQGQDDINVRYGGTGLGLPIVKNLLKFLDSKIYLESEKDQGTKFSFKITFKKTLQETPVLQHIERQEEQDYLEMEMAKVLEGRRFLVVDDNKLNQKITEKILTRKNIVCDVAGDGKLALDLVAKSNYDLILMDIHMPIMDGIETTKIIRKNDSSTPIIALTAVSLDDEKDQFFQYGFTDLIPKPYQTELFYDKIYKVLKLAQQNA